MYSAADLIFEGITPGWFVPSPLQRNTVILYLYDRYGCERHAIIYL